MHHYEQNALFNTIVGNAPIDADTQTNKDLSKIMAAQMRIIISEARELLDGLDQENLTMIRDGLGDVVVTVDGLLHRINAEMFYSDIPRTIESFYLEDSRARSVREEYHLIHQFLSVLAFIAFDDEQPLLERIEQATEAALETLVCCYSIADMFGIHVQADQDAISKSNLSKFDTIFDVAMEGKTRLAAKNVFVEVREIVVNGTKYYPLVVVEDSTGSDGRFYPVGKALKSIHYKEPVFSILTRIFNIEGKRVSITVDPMDPNLEESQKYILQCLTDNRVEAAQVPA